jgi:hypothetical protein
MSYSISIPVLSENLSELDQNHILLKRELALANFAYYIIKNKQMDHSHEDHSDNYRPGIAP